jgi:hypothetical protein
MHRRCRRELNMLKDRLRSQDKTGGEIAWRWRLVNDNVAWLLRVPGQEITDTLEPEALEAMLSFDMRLRQTRQIHDSLST